MFVCEMAVRFPSVIVRIESHIRTCRQSRYDSPKTDASTRISTAKPSALGATVRNAVTGVGAPS